LRRHTATDADIYSYAYANANAHSDSNAVYRQMPTYSQASPHASPTPIGLVNET
jgi:hypothetical protein